MMNILDYSEVLKALPVGKTHHLLIGNGFSIGCDSRFSYKNLYETAKAKGLSEQAQRVFAKLGTNNFEAVMRLLDDGHWLAGNYDLIGEGTCPLETDLNVIKETLVSSIAETHPDNTGLIPERQKRTALAFIAPYQSVFSTNYDLLPVWINMMSSPPQFQDGFRADPTDPSAPSLVFSERIGKAKGFYFIHGALHLFMGPGGLRKHCWERSRRSLIELVRDGLTQRRYPLFVAEGSHEKKMEQIQSNGYLSYCYGKLGRVGGRLITFGFSFGESDKHISRQISENEDITDLYVGIFKGPNGYDKSVISAIQEMVEHRNDLLKRRGQKFRDSHRLTATFFDSQSAHVWS